MEAETAILDVRRVVDFERAHHPSAANIPLEELDGRAHELPPRGVSILVYDDDPVRAAAARDALAAAGRGPVSVSTQGRRDGPWPGAEAWTSGPSAVRLWRPHPLLSEALTLTAPRSAGPTPPRALDAACGSGREAVTLALAGFVVDAWDILPDALERCDDLARRNRVRVFAQCRDLERRAGPEADAYDLVCVFNYLHRPLLPALFASVRCGGLLVYETFLVAQRDRYGKPRGEAHLLRPGELREAVPDGWKTIVYREGESTPGRITAALIAQRGTGAA